MTWLQHRWLEWIYLLMSQFKEICFLSCICVLLCYEFRVATSSQNGLYMPQTFHDVHLYSFCYRQRWLCNFLLKFPAELHLWFTNIELNNLKTVLQVFLSTLINWWQKKDKSLETGCERRYPVSTGPNKSFQTLNADTELLSYNNKYIVMKPVICWKILTLEIPILKHSNLKQDEKPS